MSLKTLPFRVNKYFLFMTKVDKNFVKEIGKNNFLPQEYKLRRLMNFKDMKFKDSRNISNFVTQSHNTILENCNSIINKSFEMSS